MPKKKVEKVHITVTIDENLNEWLEKTAPELGLNKSQLVNNVISMGKEDIKLLKASGVLGLANLVRKVKEEVLTKRQGARIKSAK
jgi:hypothetical protein